MRHLAAATSNDGAKYRLIETSLGVFMIGEDDNGLFSEWLDQAEIAAYRRSGSEDDDWGEELATTLARYFDGEDVSFDDVPTPDGPDFFKRCWDACRTIPRGETWSYADLAERAGSTPNASRAAGQAMARNPLPIIVPCHRIVSSSGALHGFAGHTDPASDPMVLKKRLLEMEGCATVGA